MRLIVINLLLTGHSVRGGLGLRRRTTGLRARGSATHCTTLRDRLGPRFLFGDLGALVTRVRCGPNGTIRFAGRLSDMCHCILRYRSGALMALARRLRFLRSCLFLRGIHLKSYVDYGYYVTSNCADYVLPPLALRLLTRGIVGRGSVALDGPVGVSVQLRRKCLIIDGPVRPGGDRRSPNMKLGGLSGHYRLVLNGRVVIRGSRGMFVMGMPLLCRWGGYDRCEE